MRAIAWVYGFFFFIFLFYLFFIFIFWSNRSNRSAEDVSTVIVHWSHTLPQNTGTFPKIWKPHHATLELSPNTKGPPRLLWAPPQLISSTQVTPTPSACSSSSHYPTSTSDTVSHQIWKTFLFSKEIFQGSAHEYWGTSRVQ